MAITKAMIFAAGLGTRFRPWTEAHPKALAPVNGKSLLQRNIEYLQRYGITEVVVNVHHFSGQVLQEVSINKGWGSNIILSDEQGELLETGGGLMKARTFLEGPDPFVTINVDILTDLDLGKLINYHEQHQPLISFAVTNRSTSRYFLFNDENRLIGWRNSATGQEIIRIPTEEPQQKAYSCVVVFEPEIFSLVKQQGKFSLVDAYLDLAPDHLILGFDHSGDRLVDVGKPDSVAEAEKLFRDS